MSGLSKIGIIDGYDYGEMNEMINIQPEKFYAMTGDDLSSRSLMKLISGRIEALPKDARVARYYSKKMGMASDSIVEAGQLGQPSQVYIAFSPAIEGSKKYANLLVEGIQELRASGELEKILQNYNVDDWLH